MTCWRGPRWAGASRPCPGFDRTSPGLCVFWGQPADQINGTKTIVHGMNGTEKEDRERYGTRNAEQSHEEDFNHG